MTTQIIDVTWIAPGLAGITLVADKRTAPHPGTTQPAGGVPAEKRYNMDTSGKRDEEMTHVWFWRSRLPERKGCPCRILARGKMNSILVEFSDGYKTVTSRYAVRRIKESETK